MVHPCFFWTTIGSHRHQPSHPHRLSTGILPATPQPSTIKKTPAEPVCAHLGSRPRRGIRLTFAVQPLLRAIRRGKPERLSPPRPPANARGHRRSKDKRKPSPKCRSPMRVALASGRPNRAHHGFPVLMSRDGDFFSFPGKALAKRGPGGIHCITPDLCPGSFTLDQPAAPAKRTVTP